MLGDYLEYYYAKVAAQLLSEELVNTMPEIVKCEEWVGKSGDIPVIAPIVADGAGQKAVRELLVAFTKRGSAVTQEDLDWYRFCVRKAGLSCKRMVIFTEGGMEVPGEALMSNAKNEPERIEILSLFENILEQ